jgi:AraC family transcriptional regulator
MLVLVLRGRLRWEAPDHALDLPAGSLIVDDGRAVQRLGAEASERTEVLCLWPDIASLRDPSTGLLPLLHAPESRAAAAMQRLAETLARAGMRRLQGDALQTWVDAVQDAQRDCDEQIERCHGRTLQRRRELFVRLSRARALLAAPGMDVDVPSCARAARLSTSHFVRLFREAPHQFRSRERMQWAHRLIVDTDLPVREVMRRVGFDSPPIFARAFRRHFGASATSLRSARVA